MVGADFSVIVFPLLYAFLFTRKVHTPRRLGCFLAKRTIRGSPWHGVAVKQQDKFTLMRRHEARHSGQRSSSATVDRVIINCDEIEGRRK
jgi:hypothetical protein